MTESVPYQLPAHLMHNC